MNVLNFTRGAGRGARLLLALFVLAASVGCATVNPDGQPRQSAGQKLDPWENWNRKVFAFNEGLDTHVLKPVATGYTKVVPVFIRSSIHNFFNNAEDVWSAANHFFQGKPQSGLEMVMRFGTNTVFGAVGLFDVATEAGLERQPEDFGQTLGVWGFGAGAYIVWPLLGPSSVRDSIALPLDRAFTPAVLFNGYVNELTITGVQLVDTRANLLGATDVIDQIALDKYTFVRDAYLARRRSLVYDGNPPGGGGSSGSGSDEEGLDAVGPTPVPSASPAATPASAPPK